MICKTLFAGFGGQGILMMGQALAHAAMKENLHVTYLPAYGAEVRGGTANCTVSVGDEEIASPIASTPDYLVVMNAPAFERFQNALRKGGSCLLNTSLINARSRRKDIKTYEVAASEMAETLGDVRAANMVMLGAFAKVAGLVSPETLLEIIEGMFRKKPSVLELNREAFRKGYEAVA